MAIFDELKSIGKVLQEAGKIEQYQQILDAQQKLLEMQKKINELEVENKNLRDKLVIKENLILEGNFYWMQKDGLKDGPFCSCCWDSESKLMRLHKNPFSGAISCPKCRTIAKSGSAHVYLPRDQRNQAR